MSEATILKPMTSDELFALRPSKKIDRWLFRGELRESKVTKRNPNHAGAVMSIGALLSNWLKTQPRPRGKVYGGEAYFRIRKDPDTNVGIDVALATAEQRATVKKKTSYVDGSPLLAVEVLSPYDKQTISSPIANSLQRRFKSGSRWNWSSAFSSSDAV